MAPKWTPEMQITALLSVIYTMSTGAPKLGNQAIQQLEADLVEHKVTGEGARQQVQKLLRNFTPKVITGTVSHNASTTSTSTTTKRKAGKSPALRPSKKRAKAAANSDDDEEDYQKETSMDVKEEVKDDVKEEIEA